MDFSFLHVAGRALCRVTGRIKSFVADSRAVSTVEYALIVVAVVAIVGGAGVMLSGTMDELFTNLGANIQAEEDVLDALDPEE